MSDHVITVLTTPSRRQHTFSYNKNIKETLKNFSHCLYVAPVAVTSLASVILLLGGRFITFAPRCLLPALPA
jgi:hypothetical protein